MSAPTNAELAKVIRRTAAMARNNEKHKKLLLIAADRLERTGHAMVNHRAVVLYSVYDNQTDESLAVDLPPEKCAEILGITYNSFMCAVARGRKKWTITKRYADEPDED